MKRKLTVTIITTVLMTTLGNMHAACSIKNAVSQKTINKSFVVLGKTWNIKGIVTEPPYTIEISRLTTNDNSTHTNMEILALIEVPYLEQSNFDFAIESNGNVLWLAVTEREIRHGVILHKIYPLVYDNKKNMFINLEAKKKLWQHGKLEQHNIIQYLNLSHILRQIAKSKARKGEGLSLGRGVHISNVRIEGNKVDGIIVTGKLGKKYVFSCQVGLTVNKKIFSKDFEIVSVDNIQKSVIINDKKCILRTGIDKNTSVLGVTKEIVGTNNAIGKSWSSTIDI